MNISEDSFASVQRPRGSPQKPAGSDLSHLPGESGKLAGVANALGWALRGSAHLADQARRYGPIYRHNVISLGAVVCVADADAVAAIHRNEDGAWSAARAYRAFSDGVDPGRDSLGLVGLHAERHKEARRILQPAFGPQALAGYVDTATLHYERAIGDWLTRGRVTFAPAARRLLASVADHVFMAVDDPREAAMLDQALADFWSGPLAFSKNPRISRKWRKAMRGYRTLTDTLQPRVLERRVAGGTDLFSRMSRVGEGVPWFDDDLLVRTFIGVIAGAFDTTSHAATSMAYLLAKHPTWQERLRAESRSIGFHKVGYEDLKKLEQYEWVWKETLRMHPIFPMVPRRAVRDVTLAGRRIPADALVFAMIAPLMYDPRWWSAPETFDPERFSPERAEDKRHRGAFLPFGAGAHTCLGMQFATVEMKAFWHALLSKCRIRLARDYRARHGFKPMGTLSGNVELVLDPL